MNIGYKGRERSERGAARKGNEQGSRVMVWRNTLHLNPPQRTKNNSKMNILSKYSNIIQIKN
jgi:hypothetical protein